MIKHIVMVLLAASVAAGCAPLPKVTREPLPRLQIVETLETDADRLLNYYAYMTELQGDTLLREYRFVRKSYETAPNDYNRMQMIMLLASPSASFRNTELAHKMLKDWLVDEYHIYSKLRPLALLYDNYLTELIGMKEANNRIADQMRQASDIIARQSDRIARQNTELATQKQQSKELQDKLDALLEMEKNLIEREQTTRPDTP